MSNSATAATTRMLDSILPTMSELLSIYLYAIDYRDKDHAGLSNMKHALCSQCGQRLANPPRC